MVIEANETHTLNFTGGINFTDLDAVLMTVGDFNTTNSTNSTDSSSEETEILTDETPDDNTDVNDNETEDT